MYWNYRMMKHEDEQHVWYGLHEVYWETDDSGKPAGEINWTEDSIVVGDTPKEILDSVLQMLVDINKHPEPIDESEVIKNHYKISL